jgi:hypothetical protein
MSIQVSSLLPNWKAIDRPLVWYPGLPAVWEAVQFWQSVWSNVFAKSVCTKHVIECDSALHSRQTILGCWCITGCLVHLSMSSPTARAFVGRLPFATVNVKPHFQGFGGDCPSCCHPGFQSHERLWPQLAVEGVMKLLSHLIPTESAGPRVYIGWITEAEGPPGLNPGHYSWVGVVMENGWKKGSWEK